MFNREFGLVYNPSDPERYVRLVRWEERWVPADDAMEARTLVPIVWEWTLLDASRPRAYHVGSAAGLMKLVPTAITEMSLADKPWPTVWPSDAPSETEELRRGRIRELRRACHVDAELGEMEPKWMPEWNGLVRAESVRAAA